MIEPLNEVDQKILDQLHKVLPGEGVVSCFSTVRGKVFCWEFSKNGKDWRTEHIFSLSEWLTLRFPGSPEQLADNLAEEWVSEYNKV